ncbi:MAG: hypothetical protein K2X44_10955 [Magnetospirillum sp.]|nr:hypothetical protein [Magnetospirillum sp.]
MADSTRSLLLAMAFVVVAIAVTPAAMFLILSQGASLTIPPDLSCTTLIACKRFNAWAIWALAKTVAVIGELLSTVRFEGAVAVDARVQAPPVPALAGLRAAATIQLVVLMLLSPLVLLAVHRTRSLVAGLAVIVLPLLVIGSYGLMGPWLTYDGYKLFLPNSYHHFFATVQVITVADLFLTATSLLLVLWLSRRNWRPSLKVVIPITILGQMMAENYGMLIGVSLAAFIAMGPGNRRTQLISALRILAICGVASVATMAALMAQTYLSRGGVTVYGGHQVGLAGLFAEAAIYNWPNWKHHLANIAYLCLPALATGAFGAVLSAVAERCPIGEIKAEPTGRASLAVTIGFLSTLAVAFAATTNLSSEFGRELLPLTILLVLSVIFHGPHLRLALGGQRRG